MFEGSVVSDLAGLVDRLGELRSAADDAERIDRIAVLERLKAAVYAAQLSEVAQFVASQEAANRALGFEARQARRGVPEQVGLARKVSPASAAQQVSRARALIEQMPATFGLLRVGEISEHVATIVVTETSHLAAEDRHVVDKRLADQLPELSPKRAHAAARRLVIEVDQAGAVRRASKARQDRRVSIRPAPDTMAIVSALLPCEQGVAVYAALRRQADTPTGPDDRRSRGQIMADTLVERVTSQASAEQVCAEIGLVMTDAALFGGEQTPAELTGYGPMPAELARALARQAGQPDNNQTSNTAASAEPSAAPSTGKPGSTPAAHDAATASPDHAESTEPPAAEVRRARVFLRRLFTDPATGIITDCDPRRRRFDGVLARLLVYRDGGTCRDPYCDAPIRHLDHIQPYANEGPTTPANGRGVCERGNYTRHMPGFTIRLTDKIRHIVETTTPTGHTYRSHPPPAPGRSKHARPARIETSLTGLPAS